MLPELTEGGTEQVLQEYCVGQQGRDILVAEVKSQHGEDVCVVTQERPPLVAQQPDEAEYLQNHPSSINGFIPTNRASLTCVAPTAMQFLHVDGEPTVFENAFRPSLPAATSTRKSFCE